MDQPEGIDASADSEEAEAHLPFAVGVARFVLSREGSEHAGLSLSLVGDGRMQEINRETFGRDEPTDVIAFPLDSDGDPEGTIGDIVVSFETAAREAQALGIPIREELARYVIHGVLHVLGHRDGTEGERAVMWGHQEELLGEVAGGAVGP